MMLSLKQLLESLYPDFERRTICVPPVHFNKVPYVRGTVPGTGQSALVLQQPSGAAPVNAVRPVSQLPGATPVLNAVRPVTQLPGATPVLNVPPVSQRPVIPETQYSLWPKESQPQATPVRVQDTDLHDDFAQNYVLANLVELGNARHEAMFILSQLSFGSYLNQPSYAAAAALLPKPTDLDPRYLWDGEFDIVLIHRRHGILIGELKSVGRVQAGVRRTRAQADTDVVKRVWKAVRQVDRSEAVVRHVVDGVARGLTVRKTFLLPYVGRLQLQRVLTTNSLLREVRAVRATTAGFIFCGFCVIFDYLTYHVLKWATHHFARTGKSEHL